jgi:micrococcal nuclease
MRKLLFLTLISLLACSSTQPFDNSSLPPPPQNEATEKSALVKIIKVVDGDTMDVRFKDGTTDRVRLLGVDTPETNTKNKPNEYGDITDLKCLTKWGDKSDDYAKTILDGKEVRLVFDEAAGERGYYGRLLAYIELEDYDFNESLISRGYARVYQEGTSSREERYLSIQNRIILQGIGLWGDCTD